MLRLLVALAPAIRSAMRSRRDLFLENLALRQQLATFVAKRRPRIQGAVANTVPPGRRHPDVLFFSTMPWDRIKESEGRLKKNA